ncbi:MAG TPA: class I SAM-dependent methyltransferase [Gaiellaceae bacterium]|nr:class I SAM-dependent methyltransferase [Gaiellaceae bacterium]
MTLGQRFARLVTNLVVRAPFLWRLFRGPLTRNFDRLAPEWDATRVSRERLAPMIAALESLPDAPARALDVGTGTGAAARLIAELWPQAEVIGVDASAGMIAEARRLGRERYEVADASSLPYPDGSFDLVTLNNMIPFFDELERITKPGGLVAIAFSMGARTPIWVPLQTVQARLEQRGFAHVADFAAGPGLALLARKDEVS